jgi:hypothetical protein
MQLPGEQLIIRLWETLSEKGIGSLLKPWQIKREGLAHLQVRRAELLALTQTEKDVEDIRTGQKRLEDFSADLQFAATALAPLRAKTRIEPRIDLPSVVEAAARQTIEDSVRRQVNVAHAIAHAEETLRDDTQEPPSKKVDDDWLFRWRDCAGDVSPESMQNLWGRILAGEIKAPGSFSLRTLDFLRNLSQEEAVEIEKLSRFAIDGIIWRDDILKDELPFSTMMTMQDLGILSGVEALGLINNWISDDPTKFVKAFTSNGKALVITHDDPKKTLTLPVYLLTGVGKQLLRLGKFSPHVDYLERAGRAIQQKGFNVVLADFLQVSESKIRYFNERPIAAQQGAQPDGPATGGSTG